MKKYFDIVETVKYSHRIEIEIDESQEEDFEEFAEETANAIEQGCYESKEEILSEFRASFNEDKIEFIEDGSPKVEFEAY